MRNTDDRGPMGHVWSPGQVQPHEVPGYAEAVARGLIPRIAASPPSIAVEPTAAIAFLAILVKAVAAFVATVLIASFATLLLPDGLVALACLATWVFLGRYLYREWGGLGRLCIEEFRYGYTTNESPFGTYWVGADTSLLGNPMRPVWDFSALWFLDQRGDVKRPPMGGGSPPGMYPSPSRPGQWELWSGRRWLRYYENPPQPQSNDLW